MWKFFDGASHNQMRCGARMIIHKNNNITLTASVGIGSGTNKFSELLNPKLILCCASNLELIQFKYLVIL